MYINNSYSFSVSVVKSSTMHQYTVSTSNKFGLLTDDASDSKMSLSEMLKKTKAPKIPKSVVASAPKPSSWADIVDSEKGEKVDETDAVHSGRVDTQRPAKPAKSRAKTHVTTRVSPGGWTMVVKKEKTKKPREVQEDEDEDEM